MNRRGSRQIAVIPEMAISIKKNSHPRRIPEMAAFAIE
jgi:hypothetical protein